MNVAIRVDASIAIGSGHVMRCLTLADALSQYGAEITFICRPHTGNLIEKIKQKGYPVCELAPPTEQTDSTLFHSAWLGATQSIDANETAKALGDTGVDWLIVDHYGIDAEWQQVLRVHCKKLFVIDDLGDRNHDCDVLLDQNYGSTPEKYRERVPEYCTLLIGPVYTLLRPEFAQWREYSLERRKHNRVKHLLINLGGIDVKNVTSKILDALNTTEIPTLETITVVMGSTAPHIDAVKQAARNSKHQVSVQVDVQNMAEVMANSDLAIGAAGSTTWERCALGLPTILLVLAENQLEIAKHIASYGAAAYISVSRLTELSRVMSSVLCHTWLEEARKKGAGLIDAKGVRRVASLMQRFVEKESL